MIDYGYVRSPERHTCFDDTMTFLAFWDDAFFSAIGKITLLAGALLIWPISVVSMATLYTVQEWRNSQLTTTPGPCQSAHGEGELDPSFFTWPFRKTAQVACYLFPAISAYFFAYKTQCRATDAAHNRTYTIAQLSPLSDAKKNKVGALIETISPYLRSGTPIQAKIDPSHTKCTITCHPKHNYTLYKRLKRCIGVSMSYCQHLTIIKLDLENL